MDLKKIETLAKIMNENGLNELQFSEGAVKISMKKEPEQKVSLPYASDKSVQTDIKSAHIASKNEEPQIGSANNGMKKITSPLAGVYYSSPEPDEPAFVKIGDKVKKGDVLCIIEAMKLMNELTADKDGEIVDICVENEQIVEYGQTLFTII